MRDDEKTVDDTMTERCLISFETDLVKPNFLCYIYILAQYLINKQNHNPVLYERPSAPWYDISAGYYYRQTRRIAWRPAWDFDESAYRAAFC